MTRREGALLALFLAAVAALHRGWLWRGPFGTDGLLYADPMLLVTPRPEIAARYLHVYGVAALARMCDSVPRGAGLWALIVHVLTLAALASLGYAHSVLAGRLTTLLAALCPLLLGFATVPISDTPSLLFSLGSLLCLQRATRERLGPAVLGGALLLAAMRCRETALCLIPAVVVVVLGQAPADRRRLASAGVAGFLVALALSIGLDGAILGQPLFALKGSSARTYLEFNLRPQERGAAGGTLLDALADRWLAPFSLLGGAGLLQATSHPMRRALLAWAATSAVFQAWTISMGDFGTNERYLLPVLLPLLPLGAAWLSEEWRGAWQGRRELMSGGVLVVALVVALGVIVALGASAGLTGHFLRKSFHQLLPVLWLVAVAASLSMPRRAALGAALAALLAATACASVHSARQMASHAARSAAEWQRLVRSLHPYQAEQIGLAAPSDPSLDMSLRVHSSSAAWQFTRVGPADGWPRTMLVEPRFADLAEARGFAKVAAFQPLTYTDLALYVRADGAPSSGR